MRPRSQPEVASTAEALAQLGLDGLVGDAELKAAFRTAVKAARPDQPGGDAVRFRRVIAAWRLLQVQALPASVSPLKTLERPLPVVAITPAQALNGARIDLEITGRRLRLAVPAGLRSGDRLRLRAGAEDGADLHLPVLIRAAEGLSAIGDDLYMEWPTSPRLIEDGGRVEIETHAGVRSAWLTPRQRTLRVRLKGLGLPARGSRPQGHLFVTLQPSVEAPSSAEDLLVRFTRVWTPDRLAA